MTELEIETVVKLDALICISSHGFDAEPDSKELRLPVSSAVIVAPPVVGVILITAVL